MEYKCYFNSIYWDKNKKGKRRRIDFYDLYKGQIIKKLW